MTDPRKIAEAYLALWNIAETEARQSAIAALFTPDAKFADPATHANGREEIAAMIETVRQNYPGMRFSLAGVPDGFGGCVRFSWAMGTPDAAPVVKGTDIVTMQDGRIAALVGFFDLIPTGVAA
ncbi:MAG: nuclear transport factor 2 family protein [Pseudooceanicola sp.]